MGIKQTNGRNNHGSYIAEAPIALWLLLVVFMFPFVDLAAATIRYTFIVMASRDAAHAASRAKSYLSDTSGSELSAVNLARNQAIATASGFSEITVNSVTTRILITDLGSKLVTSQTAPLATPADTSNNLYQIETVVSGQINPLLTFDAGILPDIPGLSAPIPVSVASREICENPQGLNL